MTDLTVTGDSYTTKADVDPNITAAAIQTRANDYLDGTGTDPADPLVSPIFADLTGLPPLLVQAGSHEVLLDDATGWPPERQPTTSPSSSTSPPRSPTCFKPSPQSSTKATRLSLAPARSFRRTPRHRSRRDPTSAASRSCPSSASLALAAGSCDGRQRSGGNPQRPTSRRDAGELYGWTKRIVVPNQLDQ